MFDSDAFDQNAFSVTAFDFGSAEVIVPESGSPPAPQWDVVLAGTTRKKRQNKGRLLLLLG